MEEIQTNRPSFKSPTFFVSSNICVGAPCESVQAPAQGLGGFSERSPYLRLAYVDIDQI